MYYGKRRGMRFHATALPTLAERIVKDELGMAKFRSQSLSTSIEFTVEDKAASVAVLDPGRNDYRIPQTFCHPKPVFSQGNEVSIVFDENRNSKFHLELGLDDPSCMVRLKFRPPASLGPESTCEGPSVDLLVTLKKD